MTLSLTPEYTIASASSLTAVSEMEATLEAMVGGYDVLDQHECLANG